MRRLLLLGLACQACTWTPSPRPGAGVQAQVEALVAQVAPPGQEAALLGLRDDKGKRTEQTRLLDEQVAGALVRAGAAFELAEGEETWGEEGIPARYWGELRAPVLLAGQVQQDSNWTYLRLRALDRRTGRVLAGQTLRLDGRLLARRLAGAKAAAEEGIGMQVHLLVLREEGGFEQQVALAERGRLQVGDRLQLRFRAGADCQVYAWLYSSEGLQQDLFASQQVYKGRLYETAWLTLDQANQVHTLYLVGARRLDEDKSELFESLAELIRQGEVRQFTGVEKIDQVVAGYLSRYAPGQAALAVQRPPAELGEEERFILGDGTSLASRPLLLSAEGVLAQALSFEVQ
jgi:hypothetical protein